MSDQIPVAGEADVDEAVKYAQQAARADSPWRKMDNVARREILLKFADILEANQDRLAYLTRLTLGAPYNPFGKSEIGTALICFRCKWCPFVFSCWHCIGLLSTDTSLDYAGWIDKFGGQSFPADDGFYKIVRNEPLGVVAGYDLLRNPSELRNPGD